MARRCVVLLFGALLMVSAEARAQGAGDALFDLLFGPSGQGALSLDTSLALGAIIPSETATFPIGSSSGGFTWSFDPSLGVQTRRSNSFGPMFAERPFTNGRRKLNVAVAFQHTAFDSLAGQPLSRLRDTFTSGAFTDTLVSSISLTSDRTILSASYGMMDRLDFGVIIPFGRVQASGSSTYSFRRGTQTGGFTESSSGTSSGISDIIARTKVHVLSTGGLHLGAGLDVRMPTGDSDQLLGIGTTQTKVTLIGSYVVRNVAPHFNVGYTIGGDGIRFVNGEVDLDNSEIATREVNYTIGADFAASPIITIAGDVIGRRLQDSVNFKYITDSFGSYFTIEPGTLNLVLGTIGAKVKVGGMWLITGSVVFPLTDAGVKPGITPVIGFERAF